MGSPTAYAGVPAGGVIACLAAVVLLTGCALPSRTTDEAVASYLLEWTPQGPAAEGSGDCPTLRVSSPQAAPGFATARMAYRKQPHQLEYFARHRWADSPPRMVLPVLIRAMEHGGRFEAVVGPDAGGGAGLMLDTQALSLAQLFGGDGSRVRLAARVSLVDLERREVLATKELVIEEPSAREDPQAGVAAANRALAALVERLSAFVEAALRASPGVCAPGERAGG